MGVLKRRHDAEDQPAYLGLGLVRQYIGLKLAVGQLSGRHVRPLLLDDFGCVAELSLAASI